jgi:hypothetical protein
MVFYRFDSNRSRRRHIAWGVTGDRRLHTHHRLHPRSHLMQLFTTLWTTTTLRSPPRTIRCRDTCGTRPRTSTPPPPADTIICHCSLLQPTSLPARHISHQTDLASVQHWPPRSRPHRISDHSGILRRPLTFAPNTPFVHLLDVAKTEEGAQQIPAREDQIPEHNVRPPTPFLSRSTRTKSVSLGRRGYAEVADKIKVSLVLPHQVFPTSTGFVSRVAELETRQSSLPQM